jgi:hypothetical protein
MTKTSPAISELAAVERLLRRHLAADKPILTKALLNALLAEAEAPPVRVEIVEGIGRVLQDLLLSSGAEKAAKKLPGLLEQLTVASSMMACAPLDDDPYGVPRHALGKNLTKLIKHLRKNLGCSVCAVHPQSLAWLARSGLDAS